MGNTRPSTFWPSVYVARQNAAARKVFNVRRVSLRRRVVATRVAAIDLKADKSRLALNRTEVIRLPALELILWSSY